MLKKGITDKQIMETVEILNKYNINYLAFYMSSVPGEVPLDTDKIEKIGGLPIIWEYQDLQSSVMQEV